VAKTTTAELKPGLHSAHEIQGPLRKYTLAKTRDLTAQVEVVISPNTNRAALVQ
jgi:hypothetical protein